MFGIMVNYLDWSTVQKYFTVSLTAFAIDNIYQIPLQPCTVDQW